MSNFEKVQNVTDITNGSVSTVISYWLANAIILCLGHCLRIMIPAQSSVHWLESTGKDFVEGELERAPTFGTDSLLGRLCIWWRIFGLTRTEI